MYGTCRFSTQMSLLHSATYYMMWNSFSVNSVLSVPSAGHRGTREGFILAEELFIFIEPLSHMLCNCLAFLPHFQYVLQWKSWHILTVRWCLLLMNILSDFWLNVSTALIRFLLPELIRGGVTHSSVSLCWPLALYVCKEVYHATEQALSHEELGMCSEMRSRSYHSCG